MNNREKKLLLNFVIILCFGMAFSFAGAGMAVSYIDGISESMCKITQLCVTAQLLFLNMSLMAVIDLIMATIFFGLGTIIYFKNNKILRGRDD
jgi:hypothetical protein